MNDKPNSALIEVVLLRAGGAEHAVMIADTPYDAIAARRAGLAAIGMLSGGFSRQDLEASGCIAVYRDPADLLARYGKPSACRRNILETDLKNALSEPAGDSLKALVVICKGPARHAGRSTQRDGSPCSRPWRSTFYRPLFPHRGSVEARLRNRYALTLSPTRSTCRSA